MAMARVIFNPETGVEIPETQEVREDLAEGVQDALTTDPNDPLPNVDPASPLGQLLDLLVAELESKNSEVAFLANQFSPDTASGIFLDAIARLYGLTRKTSEPTVVTCTCTGLKGTVIPYGAIVQDSNGNQLRHSVAMGATIGDNGTVDTVFSTVEHGPIEIGAHTVTSIVTVIAGWDTVDNASAGVTGRDIEPDGELLSRMKESYAINANGTVANIQANLSELDGVLDCVVLENPTNAKDTQFSVELDPHSIAVCIVGGEDEAIAEIIFRRKSAGCGTNGETQVTYVDTEHFNATYVYNIIRPTAQTFEVKVTFYDEGLNTDVQDAVKQAIVQDFLGELKNSRVTLASSVYASRFYQAVQSVTDSPIQSIQIQLNDGGWQNMIEIPADVSPTLTEDDVTLDFSGD